MSIRVTHLLDGRHFGGAEQMVRVLARNSARIGVEARVYLLSEGRLADYLRRDGTPIRVFQAVGKLDPRPLRLIAEALRADRTQIVQAHTSRTHLMARLMTGRLGLKNITTIQSPIAQDENRGRVRHPLRAEIERLGRRWTDQICPVSREEAERLVREEGAPPESVTWIPNGIEDCGMQGGGSYRSEAVAVWLKEQGESPDALVVAMVAQLRPRKGADVLVDALAGFTREGGRARVLFIGNDEFAGEGYLTGLVARASEAGVGARAHFLGFREDPWALAGGADVIALPSLFGEGLPLALLEATNHGRAVAASDVMGNRECVEDGVTGWLHAAGDAAALAGQLARAAGDREALALMGAAGRRKFLEEYELGRVLDRWRAVYERLAAGVHAGASARSEHIAGLPTTQER